MINSLKYFFLVYAILNGSYVRSESVVVTRYFISNVILKMAFNITIVNNKENFTSKDDIIYYISQFMIISPSKKKYDLKFECIDRNNNLIFQSKDTLSLPNKLDFLAGEKIWRGTYFMGLDPGLGHMIPGQIKTLEDNQNYFIKLYVDGKLIGLTHFNYRI